MKKHLHLAGYLNPSPTQHSDASWKHPHASATFPDTQRYLEIARTLEKGLFDFVFFADVLAPPSKYAGGYRPSVEKGLQFSASLDPMYLAQHMAQVTRHLGYGVTRSTTYCHPFELARSFATLDHLTQGRMAWNVVTSVADAEAQNFGVGSLLSPELRYERAHEFVDLAFKLWSSWGPDALILNKEAGTFADSRHVNEVNFSGEWFKCRGPLTVPRSPQGRPVIMQAGSSAQGVAFAATWAEVVFIISPSDQGRRDQYQRLKSKLVELSRPQESVKVLPAFMPFVARTEQEAAAKQRYHNSLVDPVAGLVGLSMQLDVDLSRYDLDSPFDRVQGAAGIQGMLKVAQELCQKQRVTLREMGQLYGQSTFVPQLVGTPEHIADQFEYMVNDGQADGFIISPAYLPGGFDDFVELVVPELQRRGLFREQYHGRNLRENLGLPDLSHPAAKEMLDQAVEPIS